MKRIILYMFFFAIAIQSPAQSNANTNNTIDVSKRSNELKINLATLRTGYANLTYERILDVSSAMGLDVLINMDNEVGEYNYFISPYYRMYFGNKHASGFFLEGFGMLNSIKSSPSVSLGEFLFLSFLNELTQPVIEDETNVALGLGIGSKWIIKNKFIIELSLGLGANILSSDYDNGVVGKGGIMAGYRF